MTALFQVDPKGIRLALRPRELGNALTLDRPHPELFKPAPLEAEATVPRRRKIWELSTTLHCSIIGTCLSTNELRQTLVKLGVAEAVTASDPLLHKQGVTLAGRRDAASKRLNKALDERHRLTINQFAKAPTVEGVGAQWKAAVQRGDIPGAYWAVLTHPATTEQLVREAFEELHMLSHLVGAANRADIRRLSQLEAEKTALEIKVERQQTQLRDAILSRDATIRDLNDMLARRLGEARAKSTPESDESEQATLAKLVANLEHRLTAEARRRALVEERLEAGATDLARERALRLAAESRERALREELESVEERLAPEDSDSGETESEPVWLEGVALLYVGGRPHQISHVRTLAERIGADLLHHDGGIEDHGTRLAGLVSRADIVLFPVDCVSHSAVTVVKRLCRQAGKPFIALRSSGMTSFLAALNRPEMTRLAPRPQAPAKKDMQALVGAPF